MVAIEDFMRRREAVQQSVAAQQAKPYIMVCMGTGGIASGARQVARAFREALDKVGLDVVPIQPTGCIGMCENDVLVYVCLPGRPRVTYGGVTPDKAQRIVEEHLKQGRPVTEWVLGEIRADGLPAPGLDFYRKQHRLVLRNCGIVNPDRIEDYLARDGYAALVKALQTMSRGEVVEEVKRSGLRGRGGAGFPTGLKWEFTAGAPGDRKFVVCNGDEGDPGAFMDRSIMEGDPHAVLEGMVIAAYAIGASEGYIYVRAEYPLAIARLRRAIAAAEAMNLLGDDILGTRFSFHLHIKEGAGAFVCGEETALLASIEGQRGMPRPRPPFPAQSGLWGCPTNINNVETYANVPHIVRLGADEYTKLGSERSRGTKVFALTGKIQRTGLVEVPMGITLREIIFDIGGGIIGGRKFKAVQIGGPSGGCLPEALLDTPVDYDSLIEAGAMMGSGGLVVTDEDTCMVDLARFFLNFTQNESCGKCTPCREGTKRMLEILTRICDGKGVPEDIERLEQLAGVIKDASLCGLGQTAPNPVLTTLRYFRDEYEAHILERRCPAGVCRALLEYSIDPELCKGCGLCLKACPAGAISGEKKQPHVIDREACIKCGSCLSACRLGAISKGGGEAGVRQAG